MLAELRHEEPKKVGGSLSKFAGEAAAFAQAPLLLEPIDTRGPEAKEAIAAAAASAGLKASLGQTASFGSEGCAPYDARWGG
jgi:hypothetical protein